MYMVLYIETNSIHFITFLADPKLKRFGNCEINMKYLTIFFLFVLVASETLSRQIDIEQNVEIRGISSQIKDFLEVTLRDIMRNGNESLGVPILDPLDQKKIPVEIDHKIAKINGTITDLFVQDLSQYVIKEAKFGIAGMKATISLDFPKVYAKAKYQLKGVAMNDIEIFGNGEFEVTIENFSFNAVIHVKLMGGIQIKSVELQIALGGLKFKATGIYDDENTSILVSEVISDMAPKFIQQHHDEITDYVSKLIVEIGNKMISNKKPSQNS